MQTATASTSATQALCASYAQLAGTLLEGLHGVCLLDSKLALAGMSGDIDASWVVRKLIGTAWAVSGRRVPLALDGPGQTDVVALPLEKSEGSLLGVFCVQLSKLCKAATEQHARETAARLKPLLDCLHRELTNATPTRAKMQVLTERTAELEWLFNLSTLKSADDREVMRSTLRAAAERLQCAVACLIVPERRLSVDYVQDSEQGRALTRVAGGIHQHLLAWAQRQRKPLLLNGQGGVATRVAAQCKILSVPVVREGGRVSGVLVFLNARSAPDFNRRHVFLARHLGRQVATLVDAQFDLMTGLYTRGGLEQIYGVDADRDSTDGSVVYIDVDRMQLVNEVHGFELGNEVIVRVAELVGAPELGDGALAARISGDRFAVVLPNCTPQAAVGVAASLQSAVARLRIGPVEDPVQLSLSSGVAALVNMPQGLARALAAAELACKKAKERGRNRVELYACEDSSMMRCHDDAQAVGRLRAAIRTDRLELYAQPIVPLLNRDLPGGYELLLRVREPDGSIVAPGSLIDAAQRYQLLPVIDRWVVRRALEILTPYRSMLTSRALSISVNVSGQSIGDEEFGRLLLSQLQAAHLPAGCLTLEITEQAALTNLSRANELFQRLRRFGCQLALDDFGTGANSLATLKSLPIARVKIDGSFIRDIVTEQRSTATVRAIVELARGYRINTVAEYVESQAIAAAVRGLGVDYAQGYAFGRPEPLEQVLTGLTRDESRRLHKLFLES
jgi:diguanylate cyclase (GGDEF)-like protein